jgi:hypothetical protein
MRSESKLREKQGATQKTMESLAAITEMLQSLQSKNLIEQKHVTL